MTADDKRPRLTRRRLEAIQEALIHRLAGEIELYTDDKDAPTQDDYDRALDWVTAELARRKAR